MIESQGVRHDIRVRLDAVVQKPVIEHEQAQIVKTEGCRVTVYTSIDFLEYRCDFLQIVADYCLFNPHVTIQTHGFTHDGEGTAIGTADWATDRAWSRWRPSDPTSAYWYTSADLGRLIGTYIGKARNGGRDYTLREFVSQFRGLAGSLKQKRVTSHLPGTRRLSDMVNGRGIDNQKVALLLAMKSETKPVPPDALGVIGEAHFKTRLNNDEANYCCVRHKANISFVVEAAFAYDDGEAADFSLGLNSAPVVGSDPFGQTMLSGTYRQTTKFGYGIRGLAQAFKLSHHDGAHLVVHVAHPALVFQDRGKSTATVSRDLAAAIGKAVSTVLKDHCASRKKEENEEERKRRKRNQEKIARTYIPSLREAVFMVMEEAAARASGNGTLPYSVRQLYYQVRPLIQEHTHKELSYAYFTPALVTEYEEAHGPLEGLIYDARGHLLAPHDDKKVPLGTVDVASYEIPAWEYDKILYIEKEGFETIFQATKLGQRYDMAIMMAKGFATRAAKQLLARATSREITILVAHDADVAGYEIARTLAEETRTSKGLDIRVIDIGLSVDAALAMGLQRERVTVKHELPAALVERLATNEYNFLKHYRIELNAMATDQLVSWIEGELAEMGLARKVVPPDVVLKSAISEHLAEGIANRTQQAVTEAIEKLLGIDLLALGHELESELVKPDTAGHRDDLLAYMESLPVTHWRLWAERRAQKLEIEATKQLDSLALQKLKQRLDHDRTG